MRKLFAKICLLGCLLMLLCFGSTSQAAGIVIQPTAQLPQVVVRENFIQLSTNKLKEVMAEKSNLDGYDTSGTYTINVMLTSAAKASTVSADTIYLREKETGEKQRAGAEKQRMRPVAPNRIDTGDHSENRTQDAEKSGGGMHHQGSAGQQLPSRKDETDGLCKETYSGKRGG